MSATLFGHTDLVGCYYYMVLNSGNKTHRMGLYNRQHYPENLGCSQGTREACLPLDKMSFLWDRDLITVLQDSRVNRAYMDYNKMFRELVHMVME